MARKCQGLSAVWTPGLGLCVPLALVCIVHLPWSEGPQAERPLWVDWSSCKPDPSAVLAKPDFQRGMLSPHLLPPDPAPFPCCWQLPVMGFFPACYFALAVPFARNTFLSLLSLAAQSAPAYCSELGVGAASGRKPSSTYSVQPISPSQVWVRGVRGLGG